MKITNNWQKKGVIFKPDNYNYWINSHAYIPTPILLNEDEIRIFLAFRDEYGIGRVGYIDVEAKNPSKIISISKEPCLDIGIAGTFDDNGVTPISVVKDNDKLHLYYAGWQLSDKVRYFLFAGMAISSDMGESFYRPKKVPILERTDEEFLLRSAPAVLKDGHNWHMIYAGGNKNVTVNNSLVPSYSLKYISSKDGISWNEAPIEALKLTENIEYGFGRPFLLKDNGIYKMWYSIRRFDGEYRFGYAESTDLKNWTRLDEQLDSLRLNPESYENEMQVFASVIQTKYGNYMFYNGNNYGETGVCYAVQK